MAAAGATAEDAATTKAKPTVLSGLMRGTFWLALRTPLQAAFTLVSFSMTVAAIGADRYGAYQFALSFGFLQFLLEFGMSSAMQRRVAEAWAQGDRPGVDRAVSCGLSFYLVAALAQAAALLGIAYFAAPHTDYRGDSAALIRKLLWLQALTSPCYGLATVAASVLQAAGRYSFIPRLEVGIVIFRFLILWGGLSAGVDFFLIFAAQTAVQIGLSLAPAYAMMVRELGHLPRLLGARWEDYRSLMHISFYMFLMQLSVVMATSVDMTILGFGLDDPGPGTTLYKAVSTPFLQIRQTGWMLAYLVMPAVASLSASRDSAALDRVKYDGTRYLVALLLPVGLLAAVYAHPFLRIWANPKIAEGAWLMRLFLVATLPLVLSVLVQMAIGVGRIEVVSLSALGGSLVNLPLSWYLTLRLGVSGVIWGTVLTTLASNMVVPGIYVFRVLNVSVPIFARRTLGAPLLGGAALLGAAALLHLAGASAEPMGAGLARRWGPLAGHLALGVAAYGLGYAASPTGRADAGALWAKVRRRPTLPTAG